ncbi:hypothetical protein RFI_30314 [Reticulomyxa filosa]|uniref:Uncharacterized protein n=1 Tax=Reticulomyxa filosa TaxID=46433 RepID=X6LYS1_RETFI|nr:hypothetical protein RFI_30314 [Reticulomyxa filosa]|eukprot:ETO07078.1 hypothetical protein RFI_30314 [Reticulomyxa filosa]
MWPVSACNASIHTIFNDDARYVIVLLLYFSFLTRAQLLTTYNNAPYFLLYQKLKQVLMQRNDILNNFKNTYSIFKKRLCVNPASCADFALLLQEARKQEMEEDIAISQALETYIPLQANNYPHTDGDDNKNQDTYDCHQHVITFLEKRKRKQK